MLGRNPFLDTEEIVLIKLYERRYRVSTEDIPEDGIITDLTDVDEKITFYYAEQKDKTSIYHHSYVERILDKFTPSSMKLFLWIAYKLARNEDSIQLPYHKVGKKLKFSSSKTFYNAVNNLIAINIIAKKARGEYWVNPLYLFNGNRIKYYKENNGNIKIVSPNL